MFSLIRLVPGSPWDANGRTMAMSNTSMDEVTKSYLNQRYGLDKPLLVQFYYYLIGKKEIDGKFTCGLICGNLGPSLAQRGNSIQKILFGVPEGRTIFVSKFGYSVRLGLFAFIFAFGLGIPIGISSALRQNSTWDYVIKFFSTLALSIPSFVVGLILIIVLGGLNLIVILPTSWATAPPNVWIVPIIVLGLSTCASVIRMTRGSMMEVMNQDYIRTARAKGLWEKTVVYVHMLRNCLIPLVTFAGPALIELMTGAFIIEMMFGFPGMGRQYVESVTKRDYTMVLGVTILYAVMIACVNILVDVIYARIDPRIRIEE
jgi:oligopeptide transport system permease protein